MKKHFMSFVLGAVFALAANAQTPADIRVGELINTEKWNQLHEYYDEHKNEMQVPFLDVLARFFIAYTSNDMQTASELGINLVENYSSELGESIFSTSYLTADAFIELGMYDNAIALSESMKKACEEAGFMPDNSKVLFDYPVRYARYCKEHGGEMLYEPTGKDETVKFTGEGQILLDGTINEGRHKLLFDTGAGVNVMISEYADSIGIKSIDGLGMTVNGLGNEQSRIAFVDSVRIGNMLFRNVPFHIVDVDTGHEKADSALKLLGPVIGQPFIKKMKEVRIDFKDSLFTVPAVPTRIPFEKSNLNYTLGKIFNFTVDVAGNEINLNFDTGGQGMDLTSSFYNRFKDYVESVGVRDSLRVAGIGGWRRMDTYCIPEFHYTMIDGREFTADSVHVSTNTEYQTGYDGLIGVDACSRNRKVIINVEDMFIDFIPDVDASLNVKIENRKRHVIMGGNAGIDEELRSQQRPANVPSYSTGPTIETRFVNNGGHVEAKTVYP